MEERVWWTRLRWRLRGATMWPAFLVAVVVDTVLLREPADRGRHRAGRVRGHPARVLLQSRDRGGRGAAGGASRAPAPSRAAAGRRRRPRGDGADRPRRGRPAGGRPRASPGGRGAGASVRPAGRDRARLRPRPRPGPLPGQRRADGHLEAGHRTCTGRASRAPQARRSFCVFVDTGTTAARRPRHRPEPELVSPARQPGAAGSRRPFAQNALQRERDGRSRIAYPAEELRRRRRRGSGGRRRS